MVVRFKKKRRRGERTYHGRHGYPRGGGSRGGRGNAGLHKHKWLYTLKYEPHHFGKNGFRNPNKKKINVISLKTLEAKVDELIKNGYGKINGEFIELYLNKAGYHKLISSNIKIFRKYVIHIPLISPKAKEKIESVGGKVLND
jgi:large subunit ribosomal protein L15